MRPSRMLAGGATLILLAGCGAGREIAVNGVTVLVSPRAAAVADAALTGRVTVVGGCLGVGSTVILWPYGTKVVSHRPLTVRIPRSGIVGLGDTVKLGGGVVDHSRKSSAPGPYRLGDRFGDRTIPAACARHDIFEAG